MSQPDTDPRVDAYIAQAAPFARPVLEQLRAAMHQALPGLSEAIKWRHPFFLLDGRVFAHMAAFKEHCSFGFWREAGAAAEGAAGDREQAMGQFGRLQSIADLPSAAALRRTIQAAAKEARAKETAPRESAAAARPRREALPVPDDFAAALKAKPAAARVFDAFAPGKQRDYIEWIVEAKRAETRARRIAEAIGWIAEGKSRNWKYEKC